MSGGTKGVLQRLEAIIRLFREGFLDGNTDRFDALKGRVSVSLDHHLVLAQRDA